ncbi:MAG: LicD family protein [Lachnospiraceae bacterium]|nr:LicD family protein [Lachnospiraceae bacterium]
MEFPENYFEGEERDGFYISSMMKKAWAAQIEVMEVVKGICKKHNLQLFADYGTMLGAVRHKGFIPWDDDIDLVMKRKDYEKFLTLADELPPKYRIINIYTEPEYTEMLTRVVNNTEISFDPEHLRQFHGCPYVVGVDIFPIDFISSNPQEDEMLSNLLMIVLGQAETIDTDMVSREEREWLVSQIEELCCTTIDRTKPIRRQLLMLGDKLCGMFSEEEANEITAMIKRTRRPKYRMDKSCYAYSIDMPFENTTVPVPVGYETSLRINYGANYMTPINKRASHDYPFYKAQEQIVKEKLGFVPV